MVHLQPAYGSLAAGSLADQLTGSIAVPGKMLFPDGCARIEKSNRSASGRFRPGRMGPFPGIAVRASRSEIGQVREATLAPRDDVINGKPADLPLLG